MVVRLLIPEHYRAPGTFEGQLFKFFLAYAVKFRFLVRLPAVWTVLVSFKPTFYTVFKNGANQVFLKEILLAQMQIDLRFPRQHLNSALMN